MQSEKKVCTNSAFECISHLNHPAVEFELKSLACCFLHFFFTVLLYMCCSLHYIFSGGFKWTSTNINPLQEK